MCYSLCTVETTATDVLQIHTVLSSLDKLDQETNKHLREGHIHSRPDSALFIHRSFQRAMCLHNTMAVDKQLFQNVNQTLKHANQPSGYQDAQHNKQTGDSNYSTYIPTLQHTPPPLLWAGSIVKWNFHDCSSLLAGQPALLCAVNNSLSCFWSVFKSAYPSCHSCECPSVSENHYLAKMWLILEFPQWVRIGHVGVPPNSVLSNSSIQSYMWEHIS